MLSLIRKINNRKIDFIEIAFKNNRKYICPLCLKDEIEDYKVYCFHGEPKFISVEKKIEANNKIINYYDLDWKLTDIETGFPYFYRLPDFFFQKPKKLNIIFL